MSVWKCNSRTTKLIRPLHRNKLKCSKLARTQGEGCSSASGMKAPPAPQGEVVEVRQAVLAARDALASPLHPDEDLDTPPPLRGAGSLLRTSLRYALQT